VGSLSRCADTRQDVWTGDIAAVRMDERHLQVVTRVLSDVDAQVLDTIKHTALDSACGPEQGRNDSLLVQHVLLADAVSLITGNGTGSFPMG
jgi:hypothetical protein